MKNVASKSNLALLSTLQIIGKFFAELRISHHPVNQSKWRWHQYSIIGKGKILRNKREGNIICLAGKWCAMGWNQYWWSIQISILHMITSQEYFVRIHSYCAGAPYQVRPARPRSYLDFPKKSIFLSDLLTYLSSSEWGKLGTSRTKVTWLDCCSWAHLSKSQ